MPSAGEAQPNSHPPGGVRGEACHHHGNRLPVFLFPVAAETNGHRLDGLKQQKFVLRQFWGPEVPGQSFQGSMGGALPCLLQLSGGFWQSVACIPWLNHFTVYLHLNILFPPLASSVCVCVCVCVCVFLMPLCFSLTRILASIQSSPREFKTTSSQDP